MKFAFVMDPLDRVTHDKDTTFAFIRAAQARGHESQHCLLSDLFVATEPGKEGARVSAIVRPVEIVSDPPYIRFKDAQRLVDLDEVDAVFIRKDPPFDSAYLYATLALDYVKKAL